uniref:Uncharacterized protein n=1 Tax=Craspedostauros australis TaxID=1486917 RepID=A0A7R9ZLI9_9STRA|eukprot:CAMPEP_0198108736 /NCGR_PEP_ID=MMETSP1442-20131203/782_1 /TAXON_ID= /ORGANISM="Craspedostauros australis, Strain CCMP3328" /LENGTH=383 /DNA_ID=CAMNT_0043764095 /DNA_START=39 /DNA_END=1190 /DNA_ORIENTATION=+
MNSIITKLLILVLAGIVLLADSTAAAASKGPRGVRKPSTSKNGRRLDSEKKKKAPSKRECEVERKSDKVEFKCKAKTENDDVEIKDEIKFKVSSKDNEDLKVKVEYKNEIEEGTGDNTTETETKTKYEIEFDRIIEYRKADEVSVSATDADSMAFDWAADTIVKTTQLDMWGEFSDVMTEGDISTFSISSTETATATVAKFDFTISRADRQNITANKMKIDFDLDSYVWAANDTYVALICSVTSERKIEVEEKDDSGSKGPKQTTKVEITFDDAIETVGFVPFGEYTWADTAQVIEGNSTSNNTNVTAKEDGETISVIATSDGNSDEIAFSFVGAAAQMASEIYWDPEAGIGYGDAPDDSAATAMTTMFAAVASVALGMFSML